MSSMDTHDDGVEPIAIVGMACRLPGAADVEALWRNLVNGVVSIRTLDRDEMLAAGVRPEVLADPAYVPVTSTLDDPEYVDHELFGMTKREAAVADPQIRLFLELAHTALEHAGYDPARYQGEIGVYGGAGTNRYLWTHVRRNRRIVELLDSTMSLSLSNHPDYVTTTTSYRLDLRGASVSVHTACSTSLVAVHLACEALRNGECDMALAGGTSIELPLHHGYLHMEGSVEAADGHCRPFDARATGTVWASGGSMVVLKRLSDALADGDYVHATVLGNAVNNDGAAKVGFTAPSVDGQAAVVATALAAAGVDQRSIGYVEAHGTATALGDPIEVAALTSVYGRGAGARGWCALGSIKSNMGHTSQAAGVAGLIKAVLALGRGLIPPNVGYESPNPAIDFAGSPFYVNATLSKWESNGAPRRAAVSSFGIGGTNAHVVLEEPPQRVERGATRTAHLLQVSARTPSALTAAVGRLAGHLAERPELRLADVAHTLRIGRRHHPHRAAVVASDATRAAAALAKPGAKGVATAVAPRMAWLFSGQGAQYAGMGAALYAAEPVFRDTVDTCAEALAGEIGQDIRQSLLAAGPDRAAADARLARTALAQPTLFTIEYALARLWQSWGVRPQAMIGHSIGEYVAATVAGVFALPDALRLVALRGRLMDALPPGSMLAVQAAEDDLAARLPEDLVIAAVNGPGACVVAGSAQAVDRFADQLAAARVGSRRLRTSHAFHSPMTEPILDRFAAAVAQTHRAAPRLPFLANRTGDWITADQATDPAYWAAHLRHTVRFGDCVARLREDGDWLFLECGPGRQLAGLVRMQTGRGSVTLHSLPGPSEKIDDLTTCYTAAGELWVRGVDLDSAAFGEPGLRVPLPAYPYERVYCWVEPDEGAVTGAGEGPETGAAPVRRPEPTDWVQVPTWHQVPAAVAPAPPVTRCAAFTSGGRGEAVVAALRAAGVEVIEVRPGEAFGRDAHGYTVCPHAPEDYVALIEALAADGGLPERAVHGWSLDGAATGWRPGHDGAVDGVWAAQERGFFSLLHLVQAVMAGGGETAVHIDALTAGCYDVLGGDVRHPEHATVAGIALSAGHESPLVSVRHVDCDPDDTGAARILDALWRDPAADADRPLALRRGRCWVRGFAPTRAAIVPDGGWPRDRGVYLITGGLGGLGLALAEDLAGRVAARLVLLGRSGLPPRSQWDAGPQGVRAGRAIAAIRRMEAAGAQVLPVAADVTDPSALRRVRDELLARFGRLDGIVHAAGVPGGGMIEARTRESARRVLAPKLAGPPALHAAFGDLPLDFVVLFSSVAAVVPAIGDVDYMAANAFLDAYAASAHGWSAPVRSLGWGAWREVGMAAEWADQALLTRLASPDATAADADPDAGAEPVDHPVLTEAHAARGGRPGYCRGVVSAERHWLLDEHRLAGTPVMPGTGQLETIRAAVAALLPRPSDAHVMELRDVTFVEPLAVPDGTTAEVLVELSPTDDGVDFTVATMRAGVRREHTHGSAGWVVPPVPAARIDLAAVRTRCAPHADAARLFAERANDQTLLSFGPRWRSLRDAWVGAGEELARLAAPDAARSDHDRWVLHPAMLDVATMTVSTTGGRGTAGGRPARLPIGYGRLLIYDRMPAQVWVYRRHDSEQGPGSGVVASNFTVVDDEGRPTVVVTDFMLRAVDPDAARAVLGGPPATAATQASAGGGDADPRTMAPGEALEAFHRAMAVDVAPHLLIAPIRYDDQLRRSAEGAARILARLHGDVPAGGAQPAGTRDGTGPAGTRDGGTAPRNDLEATLARAWSIVLDVEDVGVHDDFFGLGGNSLVAVQLIAQIRKATGVRIPMRALFDSPTVAGMAARVAELRDGRPGADTGAGPPKSDVDAVPADRPQAGVAPTEGLTIPRLPRLPQRKEEDR